MGVDENGTIKGRPCNRVAGVGPCCETGELASWTRQRDEQWSPL